MDHSGGISPAFGVGGGLSAGFGSHMPPLQQLQAHLLRSNPLGASLPNSPFLPGAGFLHTSPFAAHHGLYMTPHHLHSLNIKQEVSYSYFCPIDLILNSIHREMTREVKSCPHYFTIVGLCEECWERMMDSFPCFQGHVTPKGSPGVGAVSSTMEVDESPPGPGRKPRVRREPATTTTTTSSHRNGHHHHPDCDGIKEDEPEDFIETHCNWRDCGIEFLTQSELVKVISLMACCNEGSSFLISGKF